MILVPTRLPERRAQLADTIQWTGKSGKAYTYWIYLIGANLKAEAGNYIFARETKPNTYMPIYIGQTENLSERFDNHHKKDCIKDQGATHIHAHLNANKQSRLDEESDLIAKWMPACND
jgi:hypothetical protein